MPKRKPLTFREYLNLEEVRIAQKAIRRAELKKRDEKVATPEPLGRWLDLVYQERLLPRAIVEYPSSDFIDLFSQITIAEQTKLLRKGEIQVQTDHGVVARRIIEASSEELSDAVDHASGTLKISNPKWLGSHQGDAIT